MRSRRRLSLEAPWYHDYTPQIKRAVFFGSYAEPFAERLRTQPPLDTELISLYSKRRTNPQTCYRVQDERSSFHDHYHYDYLDDDYRGKSAWEGIWSVKI